MILVFSTFSYAGFMDSIGDVVKSTLGDEDAYTPEVKTVGTLSVANTEKEKEEKSMLSGLGSMVGDARDSVSSIIGLEKEKREKKSSILEDTVTAMKEVVGLKKVKQDNSLFDGGIMGDMADMIDLEKGDSWGLPSVFGLNKKKQKKVFGSTILGDTLLGDIKNTSTGFYRGFKNTGESTEFMSGIMYKSSKVYNGMFSIFDDSVLNVFDDKDEREPSVFDVFDKGNDVLDIFD